MLTDRAHAAIDAFSTGLDHAMIALGYLAGLVFIVATIACVTACSVLILRDPARRAHWRIDRWRN